MRKVEPYVVPGGVVEPYKTELTLDDKERHLFDSVAQEHVQIHGTVIDVYYRNIPKSQRDKVYDEPTKTSWSPPTRLKAYVEWPDSAPVLEDQGEHTEFNATAWVSRKELEDAHAPIPSEGDVLRVWRTPFFDAWASDNQNEPDQGFYFNIVDVDDDGHLFDTASFVGVRMTIRRNNTFSPERRIKST
jgi:hypothetical protein